MTTPPTVASATARAAVFSPPRLRRTALRRPRLNRRLDDALEGTFTVVGGPAGYGKSTLAADWLEQLALPHTWLSLDRSHRDPRVLLRDLAGAVRAQFPHAMRKFARRLETARGETEARLLVREFSAAVEADVEGLFVFVIDDVHTLAGSPAIDALDALVHHPPPNVRLVLLTRAWDVLPELARLVATGAAVALLEADLAFDDAEAARLLRRSRLRDRDTIRALTRRADGWPAALALLAEHHTTAPAGDADATGAFVLSDFLDREVLARLTPAQLAILEICAVLELFEADLLHELAGSRRGAATLRKLELHTQLIVRADDATTYRIHGLLAEHLVARLTRDAPDRLRALRRAACAAYERRGNLRRAVAFALDVCDWAEAALLLARLRDELFSGGEWPTLASWLGRLPDPVLQSNPDLALAKARVATRLGDAHSGLVQLEGIQAEGLRADQKVRRLIYIAVALRRLGRIPTALQACGAARSLVAATDIPSALSGELDLEEGLTLGVSGRFELAKSSLARSASFFSEVGDLHRGAEAHDSLGSVLASLGRHREAALAYRHSQRLSRLADDTSQEMATRVNQARLLYMVGDLDGAATALHSIYDEVRRSSLTRLKAYAELNLAFIDHDRGYLDGALSRLSVVMDLSDDFDDSTLVVAAMLYTARVLIERGDDNRATDLLSKGLAAAEQAGMLRYTASFGSELGTLALRAGRWRHGIALFRRAIRDARRSRSPAARASVDLLLAGSAHGLRDRRRTARYLARARESIHAAGYDQFIIADVRRFSAMFIEASEQNDAQYYSSLLVRASVVPALSTPTSMPRSESLLRALAMGPARVYRDGNLVTRFEWRSIRAIEMFFLLLEVQRPMSKEEIAVAIWPDISPARVNSAFHSTLYRLRRAVGTRTIMYEDCRYGVWDPVRNVYDAHLFRQSLTNANFAKTSGGRQQALERAVALYQGPFLEGFESEWIERIRDELRLKYSTALIELADVACREADWRRGIDLASKARACDPLSDLATEMSMRAFVGSGRIAPAIEVFEEYAALASAHNAGPSRRLRELYSDLRPDLARHR